MTQGKQVRFFFESNHLVWIATGAAATAGFFCYLYGRRILGRPEISSSEGDEAGSPAVLAQLGEVVWKLEGEDRYTAAGGRGESRTRFTPLATLALSPMML